MRASPFVAFLAICSFAFRLPCALRAQEQPQSPAQAIVPAVIPALTVDSPMPYQVFQRQTAKEGFIAVRGRVNISDELGGSDRDLDHIEVCIEPESGPPSQTTYTGCPHVHYDRATRAFNQLIGAHSGGFYRVDIRVVCKRKQAVEQSVEHVGIGEVFVIAGQSNSTNYGEVRQTAQSGYVTTFDGVRWRIANDPQPGVQDTSSQGSFIPPFGDAMYAKFHVPIGIASVGHGSTSVRQWLPKGERFSSQPTMTRFTSEIGPDVWECDGILYSGLLQRIRELDAFAPHNQHGFRALLWHQGESDANQKPPHEISGAEYQKLLAELIRSSRDDAGGWRFPWFVAQVSYHSPNDPMSPEIRDAQASLWRSGLALQGPDTDQLTGPNRQNHGQGVHMSDMGLKAHGQLWADKISAWLERQGLGNRD